MRAIIVIFSANPLEDNVASKDHGSVSDGHLLLTVLVLPAEFQAGLGCLEKHSIYQRFSLWAEDSRLNNTGIKLKPSVQPSANMVNPLQYFPVT